MKEAINPSSLPAPPGYSQLVRVTGGTTVHIAGQVSWDREGNLVGADDFEAQTRQVFSNLTMALAAVGADLSDLVRIGIYVVDHDLAKLETIRTVRDELFAGLTPPASTLLGVERLAIPGLMIEVDGIAVLSDQSGGSVDGHS
ncbi:MAG TPA: RidA family protein [Acidimicrobiia bacterium]|nr:RidA family protein [Acidimicrobiia bacterium]